MKKLFHIPTTFTGKAIEQILVLRIGKRHCCFAITDNSGKKLFQLAYYSTDKTNEGSLINLFANHPELNNPFIEVLVCYDFYQNVLVPEQYFKSEEATQMIKRTYGPSNEITVAAQSLPESGLYNIYAVTKEVSEWLKVKFPTAKYFHNYSVGIQNISGDGNFLIDFRVDEFSLIVTKENKLLLAQNFAYSNSEDVLYYLLKATQQFSFSQKEVRLTISGLIEKDSALFGELCQYFQNIQFRNAQWITNNEYPAHFFSSLNDLIQCAS